MELTIIDKVIIVLFVVFGISIIVAFNVFMLSNLT